MHPAFVYIVVHALDEESRRANSYLPDPDPSVEPEPRRVAAPPSAGVARPWPPSPASPPPFEVGSRASAEGSLPRADP